MLFDKVTRKRTSVRQESDVCFPEKQARTTSGGASTPEESTPEEELQAGFRCIADSCICPISQELPENPVSASDGKIYNRASIQDWFDRVPGPMVKSPVTGEQIDKKLRPAPLVLELFENFIVKGIWKCERAMVWLTKYNEAKRNEARVKELKEGAASGDRQKMFDLGDALRLGLYGISMDRVEAHKWYKNAADLSHPTACVNVGLTILNSRELNAEFNGIIGMAYLQSAALLGSEAGCFEIGKAYARGLWGYPQDDEQARKYYSKMNQCSYKDGDSDRHKQAREYLKSMDNEAEE